MRLAQVPESDVHVAPVVWHLIVIAVIDVAMDASVLLPPKTNIIRIRHTDVITQGQLPLGRRTSHLNLPHDLRV